MAAARRRIGWAAALLSPVLVAGACSSPTQLPNLTGTWKGTSKREGSDSILTFTIINSDSAGKVVFPNVKDTVTTLMRFDGDSVIVMSSAYREPGSPKNAPQVTFRSVGRIKDGKLVGVAAISPAAKPDTVVTRVTWEATKAP